MYFPISGVEINPLIPLVAAFAIACLTAPAGVSGAFLLLPFQMSVLGFAGPAVSSTNLVYNLGATPGGIFRYIRDDRMAWSLAWVIALGSIPGVLLGAALRVRYLSSAAGFQIFVGLVLLYVGASLLRKAAKHPSQRAGGSSLDAPNFSPPTKGLEFSTPLVLALSAAAGVLGGVYGVGGAAMIAPVLVAVVGLPVRAVAGATLLGTLVASAAGVAFFYFMDFAGTATASAAPDWLLGGVLALGGLAGTYTGAWVQPFLPEAAIRLLLGLTVLALALAYLSEPVLALLGAR